MLPARAVSVSDTPLTDLAPPVSSSRPLPPGSLAEITPAEHETSQDEQGQTSARGHDVEEGFDDETGKITRLIVTPVEVPLPRESAVRGALVASLDRDDRTLTRHIPLPKPATPAATLTPAAPPRSSHACGAEPTADTPTTGIPIVATRPRIAELGDLPSFDLTSTSTSTSTSTLLTASISDDDDLDATTLARRLEDIDADLDNGSNLSRAASAPNVIVESDDRLTMARPLRLDVDPSQREQATTQAIRHDALALALAVAPTATATDDLKDLKVTADLTRLNVVLPPPPPKSSPPAAVGAPPAVDVPAGAPAAVPAPPASQPREFGSGRPSAGGAIQTPMVMIAPEDHATRFGPLAMPLPQMRTPNVPMLNVPPPNVASRRAPFLELPLAAYPTPAKLGAFITGTALVAAIVFILLRAGHGQATNAAAAAPPEAEPVPVLAPVVPSVAPAQAVPPTFVTALPAATPVVAQVTPRPAHPAPPTTTRSEAPPRRKVVSRPPPPSSRAAIPVRREQ